MAALVAGDFVIWNNRQRPHDALKTYVEIWKELPENAPVREALWREIDKRLTVLTTESGPDNGQSTTPIERELASHNLFRLGSTCRFS